MLLSLKISCGKILTSCYSDWRRQHTTLPWRHNYNVNEVEFITCGRQSHIILIQFQSFLCNFLNLDLVNGCSFCRFPRKKTRDRHWFQAANSDPQDVVFWCEVSAADLSAPFFNHKIWSFIQTDSLNPFPSNFTINREGVEWQIRLHLAITRTARYATRTLGCCLHHLCLPVALTGEEVDFHDDYEFLVTNTEIVTKVYNDEGSYYKGNWKPLIRGGLLLKALVDAWRITKKGRWTECALDALLCWDL